jgi:aminoglycoside phosphotransferase family enzyme/predicted kinase
MSQHPPGGALVDDLLRPAAYPPPRPEQVRLATTHASWVFLTDEEVWKVKRPVDYGFLDYSDAGKRRRACEDEVRLGARLAPDVYRGVVPVLRGPAGASFVGPGEAVDAAVRMRRLPDDESALALVRAGQLLPAHLRALADRLAAFYAGAERTDGLGAPAVLRGHVEENHRQTAPHAGRYVGRDLVEHLYRWQLEALAAGDELLRRRAREGRVRDGHGDLRLEHVYFLSRLDGAPVVIDPIEFNPAFRCQDAALDVAFLAMELEAEARPDLAAYLLAAFARAANDYGFYPLADLYLSHRAWVRAKVACFVADDPGTPADKARRKIAEAARLFSLAESFARPRPRAGVLFVVGGMIGAGKSTVAEALGLALRAPVVSSDLTRKGLAGLPATAPGGARLYADRATVRTYREMLHRAESVLASGRDAVLDGTFRQARFRLDARALARRHGCRFLFLAVDADDETLRARLRARAGTASASDAREDLLPWARRHYQPPTELGPGELLPVDGRAPAAAIVDAVRARVGAPGPE